MANIGTVLKSTKNADNCIDIIRFLINFSFLFWIIRISGFYRVKKLVSKAFFNISGSWKQQQNTTTTMCVQVLHKCISKIIGYLFYQYRQRKRDTKMETRTKNTMIKATTITTTLNVRV